MGVGCTSIGALSEVWVGGRRDAGCGSGWGSGPRTTLDLTHVRHIRLYNLVAWTINFLNDNKSHNVSSNPTVVEGESMQSVKNNRHSLVEEW